MKFVLIFFVFFCQTLAFADGSIFRCGNDFSDHSSATGKVNCQAIGSTTKKVQNMAVVDSERIPVSVDGHFRIAGSINDQSVDFLVDTGASEVVVSAAFAQKAGLTGGNRVRVLTASGSNYAFMVDGVKVQAGNLEPQMVSVAVQPSMDSGIALLGQGFLKKFHLRLRFR